MKGFRRGFEGSSKAFRRVLEGSLTPSKSLRRPFENPPKNPSETPAETLLKPFWGPGSVAGNASLEARLLKARTRRGQALTRECKGVRG